jgi:hypothetical protein
VRLSFDDTTLHLRLADGRSADVPLAAFERLRGATREQLQNGEIIGECEGIHWPDIDEDISLKGLLAYG